ncbi:pirin family protein [Bdellovibrio bacteriovorus]|uniref:Quercetin 2,3-dioxygenase n=1 Tax=Bdellovibrio bacteriovorus TaxID=959 RepID=A0A1Z3N5B5_BDEBC|nr:pirin family protein [Bdellovibrio bacteriovorus]AHZ83609.1 quercetin 2,3-dioxygenase [Bdellovibrio bacteriovorus]ASD62653.1 quercetin 2,3-dioxygenase [Bdellovibrio bacteriovorus]BEV69579.1 Quercetin 2,3-dioxygenase [Bdellovibrio bacteriovorus]
MMYQRKSEDRGYAEFGGWLKSMHTFSFADYYDPKFMGYRDLRVINQDWIAKSSGFPAHPHRDMEIITYVLKGAVEHRDSLGNVGQIKAGEIQTMHAGTGMRHSEYNPSETEDLQLFQIWIMPDVVGATPGYTQQSFTREQKLNQFKLIVSKDGREGSQKINQDADLYASVFTEGYEQEFALRSKRGAWLQLAEGELEVNGQILKSGDALVVEEENLKIKALKETEFLLFDLR